MRKDNDRFRDNKRPDAKGESGMSRTLKLMSLALVAMGLMFLGCEEFSGTDPGGDDLVRVKLDPYGTDIIAGQSEDVGDIEVSFSEGYVYVEYTTTGDWYLYEAHVSIELDWQVIPQRNGNPVPGQFDYKDEFDNTQSYTFEIPWLEKWDDADYFYIAGHCALEKVVGGEVVQEETGWGDGEDFPGSNWGMWFRIPVPLVSLRNSVLNPISPRDGIRNSMRTRPVP